MSTPTASLYSVYDLDQNTTWRAAMSKVASVESTNFAVCFDREQASVAIDLDEAGLDQWVRDHEAKLATRWIHFWADQSQRPLVESLASRYDLSLRLVALICPQIREYPKMQPTSFETSSSPMSAFSSKHRTRHNDIESKGGLSGTRSSPPGFSGLEAITFGDVLNDLWHFHSVDWGQNYVHIGVNMLAAIPNTKRASDKPTGKRLWSSIVLCHDGTVISTLERPHYTDDSVDVHIANETVRRHVLSIFSQISRLAEQSAGSQLMNTRVRPDLKLTNSPGSDTSLRNDCASLLFYYLFDDWMSTYALIARREHPYRDRLERIRQDLARAPDVHLLETLHDIGRQLNTLRLMYQSYATVVTRLLAGHGRNLPTTATPRNWGPAGNYPQAGADIFSTQTSSTIFHGPSSEQQPDTNPYSNASSLASSVSAYQTHVSSAALFRFERLLDRIHLYALSEINNCIAEKESLAFMTFNLLSLSESRTVEKLTRTTVLLAKATITFLPVSLLTGYFSIQVGNIDQIYSLRTYWLSFLVVTVASIVFLIVFSLVSDTIEDQLLYQSLRQMWWGKGVAKVKGRRSAKDAE